MKYKQEFLNCFETEDTIRKLKAIIDFIESKEKRYNKEITEFTREELKKIFYDIYYYINYYFEVVKELEK